MKLSFKLLLVPCVAILFLIACRKTFSKTDSEEFDAAAAKEWYYGNFKKSAAYSSYNSELHGKKLPDWTNGVYKKIGDMEVVEFPLIRQKSIVQIPEHDKVDNQTINRIAEATLSRITFIKKTSGEIIVRELTFIPDKSYLESRNFDISKNSMGNIDPLFTGVIIAQNWNGTAVSRSTYENGKVIKRSLLGTNSNTQNSNARLTSCSGTLVTEYARDCETHMYGDGMITQDCTGWFPTGGQWFFPDDCGEGECGDPTSVECFCQLIGGCENGGEGGQGGNGGQVPPVTTEVINNLTTTCFIQYLNLIGNARLKSEIIKMYNETFVGTNKVFDIRFQEAPHLIVGGEETMSQSDVDPNDPTVWVVTLNTYFADQGTQEYWVEAILHEIIHGFINLNGLDFTGTTNWHQEHEIMLERWITQIQDAIMDIFNWFPGDADDALALALGGIEDVLKDEASGFFLADMVDWVQQHYGIDLNDAEQLQKDYADGTFGTPCN